MIGAGIIGFGIALSLVGLITWFVPSEVDKKIELATSSIESARDQVLRLIRKNEDLKDEARVWKYKYNLELHHKESLQASQTFLSHYLDEANRTVAELKDKIDQLESELDMQESCEIQEAEGQLELELLEEDTQ